ncbi:MAG TPA: DUF167 family protein [Bdellovibrionales bacterium]|nr:DUF167 family protein [Bdellovibrionales bacterium]
MNWLTATGRGVLLRLQIQPQASKSEVVGPHGDRLKLRIAAPPVDGKANEEVLRFVKELLGVSNRDLELVRGQTSRAKDVLCTSLTAEDVVQRFQATGGKRHDEKKQRK